MRGARGETVERAQRLAAGALVLLALGLLAWRWVRSPEVAWVWQHGDARWITDPRPVDAAVQQWGRSDVPIARFARRFVLEAAPASAELRVRAARTHRVWVNGTLAGASPDPDPAWRRDRILDVARWLRSGENEIAIEVSNGRGPPLLRARLTVGGIVIPSGVDWTVSTAGSAPAPAVLPDDTRPHPGAPAGPRPAAALRARAPALAALALVAAVTCATIAPRVARHRDRLPRLALGGVTAVWLLLFASSFVRVPLSAGFDATNHLRYVDLLRERSALPLPGEGWSTYHPPLYHAAAAAVREITEPLGARASAIAVKLLSFGAGLAQAWLAGALAATLAPGRPVVAAVAIGFAGCLPLNLYMAAYVSNEPLHAFWFGLSTVVCARALVRSRVRTADALALGAALGAALLTKVTALVAAAVAPSFLLAKAVLVERARPGRLAGLALATAAPAAALAGWFYLRNQRLFGTPVVANWDLPGLHWWSQPGFHTWAYYLGFGESLRRPVFAGFRSFADSLYSSFWGDGWAAGRASAVFAPEFWDWQWAALGYWLALPATLVLAVGIGRSARLAFGREPGARAAWSFVLALQAALAFAFFLLTLQLPYFGQAKAPYLLGLVAPLAVQFALGAELCDRFLARVGGAAAATAGRALLATTAAVFLLSFAGP
jgi:hypothetical protein